MLQYLLIALGGAGGALSRYGVGRLCQSWFPSLSWPIGTFAVNIVGSALIGVAYVLITERGSVHTDWRYVLMVGFFGAFTTFSTFSLEAVAMLESGRVVLAFSYMLASLSLCVLACWLGIIATR